MKPGTLYTSKRGNKIAIWLVMPDGREWNVGDVEPHEWTDTMQTLVRRSVQLGMDYCQQAILLSVVDARARWGEGCSTPRAGS